MELLNLKITSAWLLAVLVTKTDSALEAFLFAGLPPSSAAHEAEAHDFGESSYTVPCRATTQAEDDSAPAWTPTIHGCDRILVAQMGPELFGVWLAFWSTREDSEAAADAKGARLHQITGRPWATVAIPRLVAPADSEWDLR